MAVEQLRYDSEAMAGVGRTNSCWPLCILEEGSSNPWVVPALRCNTFIPLIQPILTSSHAEPTRNPSPRGRQASESIRGGAHVLSPRLEGLPLQYARLATNLEQSGFPHCQQEAKFRTFATIARRMSTHLHRSFL